MPKKFVTVTWSATIEVETTSTLSEMIETEEEDNFIREAWLDIHCDDGIVTSVDDIE